MAKPNNSRGRSAEYQRLYKTARWRKFRLEYLDQHPLCAWCLERGEITAANEVHHHGPHRGDIEKFWDGPFVSTCKPCHSSRGQREDLGLKPKGCDENGWPL